MKTNVAMMMKRFHYIKGLIFLLACTFAGCSTYKEYSRPEMPQIDSLYFCALEDTGSIADLGWRDFFPDPLLQKLIESGLENNADLRTASLNVKKAEESLGIARKAFLPGFNFSPDANLVSSEVRYGGGAYSLAIPITASWEIDFSGKLLASRRKAAASLDAMQLTELSIRTEVISGIAECYYTLLKLDAQLEITRTTAESWKENVRTTKALMNAGVTNEASVARTEANSCSIEASVYDLRHSITQMENALTVLTGVPDCALERGKLDDVTMPEIGENGVKAALLSRRPDIKAGEARLRSAFYGTQIARAAFYPSVTITGEAGWEKALTTPYGWLFSLGASMLQPLFAKGRLKGNLEIAKAEQEEALVAFRQSLLVAGKEVNDALSLCRTADGKTDVRNRQIESLVSAVRSTEQLMRHSGSTYLEVLTAQQSLLSARLLQVSDRFDVVIGTVNLYKALGGGWH